MRDHNQKWNATKVIGRVADLLEFCVALLLILGIVVLLFQMIWEYVGYVTSDQTFDFNEFLSKALNLIIGLEFTRMLCRHTPNTIIEVLMFATARQLIVAHPGVLESMLGIVTIAMLFAIRKYLLPEEEEEEGVTFHRLSRKRRETVKSGHGNESSGM